MPFPDLPDRSGLYGNPVAHNPGPSLSFLDLGGVQLGGGRENFQPAPRALQEALGHARLDIHPSLDRQGLSLEQGLQGFYPMAGVTQGLMLGNMHQQQPGPSGNNQSTLAALFQGGGGAITQPLNAGAEAALFPNSLSSTLTQLQKNISTLQALIPLLNQQGGPTREAATIGVANVLQASMAQLASAAAGLLPPPDDRLGVNSRSLPGSIPFNTAAASGPRYGLQEGVSVRGANYARNMLELQPGGSEKEEEQGGTTPQKEEYDSDENLPEGSYDVMELDAMEILAEHTHFCEICNKGFKRDANLRMHMRGHGDQYKTAAALARPDKAESPGTLRPKRYSCPHTGCKRNRKHPKFQPLKTMLCVKNHYRRSHCPKVLACSKCGAKKFSVVADLKTHEKHCGREKWTCSCQTTFSRKDKLLGHLNLFKGHSPVLPSPTKQGPDSGASEGTSIPTPQATATSMAVAEALGLDVTEQSRNSQPRLSGSFDTPNLLHSFFGSSELPVGALDGQDNMGVAFPLKLENQGLQFWDRRDSLTIKR